MKLINKYDLYAKALDLRKRLGQDMMSPIDVFSVSLTIDRITLVFYPMGEHISGMCIKNNGYPIIAINSSMSVGRQRFSMAHELYHLYFDESEEIRVCAIQIDSGNEIEKAANLFASYFLMPPHAFNGMIRKLCNNSSRNLGIKEIVFLEQYFGVSRQALLFRLVEDNILSTEQANQFREGVILSAVSMGYDDSLYRPLPKNRQYKTYGYYINKAEELLKKGLISSGKYEELLLSAFRPDLVYGYQLEGGELND